jgi:enoyl-CoA hydratase/3-hydroxyacyl-CoA dehydrogenase
MAEIKDKNVRAIFQPDGEGSPRALLVAGACGNVGYGKLGQFARLLGKHGVPVIALDLSVAVHKVKDRLRGDFGRKFKPEQVNAILSGISVVQGTLDDIPTDQRIGFVFEAIPERLDIKRPFYEAVRKRDPEAYLFSATSGLTTRHLYEGLDGAERSGVMHPFFPHLTNKLWEVPDRGCTTSKDTLKAVKKFLGGLGHSVITTKDVPAFAADRLFCGMMLEAVRIHDELGLSPAQVDDACKKLMGTSPFFVHNLIAGANYLSAHCMELLHEEVESSLYAIPDVWRPYIEDPKKQWPYERGEKCPKGQLPLVRERLYGMMFCLTAYMLEHDVARTDAINFLSENALAFRLGTPALVESLGNDEAISLGNAFIDRCKVTKAEEIAPLAALRADKDGWGNVYVHTAVHGSVGLLSLKRTTLNHVFIAELDAAYEKLQADDAVEAIVIAPDGTYSREFGHGADPSCFAPVLGKYDDALGLIQGWKRTLSKLRKGKPTVAALVGRVLGGGLEFASSCHARIAGKGTVLGQPEPTVGVIPGLGGCHHIHRFSNEAATKRINELLLTGHSFSADEGAQWGFVSEIVPIPELPGASMALAAKLGSGAQALPEFRTGPSELTVDRDVNSRNEAGVPHDADLRELIASTVEECNNLPWAEASSIEEQRAAKSLTMSTSAIGVKAMMRGKPPQFENPLGGE